MRQIALFTTDWNYELVGETLRGVLDYLEQHPDVSVRVFDCFGIDEQVLTDTSIYQIYRLADLDQYDGAVVQTHQIVLREEAGWLGKALQEKGLPAVTIGVPLGDMPEIRSDDYEAFRHIAEHLVRYHQARKIWFLKGPEQYDIDERSEARQRRCGFQDACAELGIPEENIRYLEGNWKVYSGEAAAREILAAEDRPDTLVCANDEMALGAISLLRKEGIRVPEDLRVIGFDGIFRSSLCTPRLATMDRDFRGVGYRAMDTVVRMIEGEQVPPVIINGMRDMLVGTCGCRGDSEAEMIRIKGQFYRQTQFLQHFYLTQDKIASAFFSAKSVKDVMWAIEEYSSIFGGGFLRVYLDRRYYRVLTGEAAPEEEAELTDGKYSGEFVLAADSRRRIARDESCPRISAGDTQFRFEEGLQAEERLTQYYQMQFGKTMVGVLMMRGLCAAADMNLHESIINEMVLSLENVRQRQTLKRMNEKLNDLYVTDQLTGLYNRFGLARFGKPLFERLRAAGEEIAFIFLDIDDMKGINDRYGHEAGDEALRMTAEILRRVCGRDDYLMRYGGDEFIAFGPSGEPDPTLRIGEEAKKLLKERKPAFRLNLSAGRYICRPDQDEDLESCLQAADLKMYEMKKRRKAPGRKAPSGG